jgi:hypothetical protein
MKLGDNICPRCGEKGYGIFTKWVLNERKQRFEPYYYFAHREKDEYGHARQTWCYIRKAMALAILHGETEEPEETMEEEIKVEA